MAASQDERRFPTGLEPYADWRLNVLSRLRDPSIEDDRWWLAHVQLANMSLKELERTYNDDGRVVVVPDLYRDETDTPPDHRLVIVYAKKPFFDRVGKQSLPAGDERPPYVARVTAGPEVPEFAAKDAMVEPPRPPTVVDPGTVIMAVVDDGIAFAHERFRTAAGGTRVEYAWIMEPEGPGPSATVPQGRELDKAQIDGLLQDCTHGGMVDEDELYRRAGLIDHAAPHHKAAAQRVGHGTHVMDVACGADPDEKVFDRPIICVQLPAAVTRDTSLPALEEPLQLALDYILDRAARFVLCDGTPAPVVINFSYGAFAGPHDGSSPVEVLLDERLRDPKNKTRKVRAVLPAGNGNLARCHAEVRFPKAGSCVDLHWRVQPDDRTESRMEIWLPHTQAPAVSMTVAVRPPDGLWTDAVPNGSKAVDIMHRDQPVGRLSYYFEPYPTERVKFVICLLATAMPEHPAVAPAPCGLWTVRLQNVLLGPEDTVHAWIQRDDTPHGYPPRGRQSYFDDPDYERFDHMGRALDTDPPGSRSYVRRAGTISSIATGFQATVVAGYRRGPLDPAGYSAAGPVSRLRDLPMHRPGRRRWPRAMIRSPCTARWRPGPAAARPSR